MTPELLRRNARDNFPPLRDTGLTEEQFAPKITIQLAQHYNVSRAAMGHRLKNWPLSIVAALRVAFRTNRNELPD